MRTAWLALAGVLVTAIGGCGPVEELTPELAVLNHISRAKSGDAGGLRHWACGDLAAAMERHTDDEVREEFIDAYDNGPDRVALSTGRYDPNRPVVVGFYDKVTDLDIAFTTEDHNGWKVCEIRRGNGMFGPLPGPFEKP